MLKELYIENLAIIEKAVIGFDKSLNVFSGETGAGKSILIGGINAVLGGRVSKDIVRAGANKATVTALFDNFPDNVREKLTEYGYASDASEASKASDDCELILTREISDTGSSTARVNGKTATAAVLKEISAGLIDIHGQHHTRMIISRDAQLELIDSYGKISLNEYKDTFREFSRVSKQINTFQKEEGLKNEKIEILNAKIADVEPYKLRFGEEEEVSLELERLRNIQTVSETLNGAYVKLSGDSESETGAVDLLNLCKLGLSDVARFIPVCKTLKERVDAAHIELSDIKHELSVVISDNCGTGGAEIRDKLSAYEERMSDFLRLRRKYGLSVDELIEATAAWREELEALQNGDDFIQKLTDEKKQLGDKVKRLGGELSIKRNRTAKKLSELICKELEYLDMPGTRLVFNLTGDKVTITGMDSAELLISVNKGEAPKPLSKIASGGELSRIMLAIKVVFAESDDVPVMIFDEVDAGISGRAAYKVGLKLAELSKERQVLCVTHLAQIASMADNHLLIEKSVGAGERTFTSVKKVTGEQRKVELARIISGDEDEISLANAERLLEKAKSRTVRSQPEI
ncbi:MAG: DNA repair protein RecN [Oscillospiraceae bacterium]|nr:DNA repair protein RecN [Oscillospiraceae bacterium]